MKAACVIVLTLIPFGAFGGVYTCVEGDTVTYSDQVCTESAGADTNRVARPTPRANPLRVASARPESKETQKSEKAAVRKALERRLREADEELMWLYRERRAALENHIDGFLAKAGDDGVSEEEIEQEREAFKADYEKSIKELRRELNDLRRQLEEAGKPYRKASYAAR